jgi:hypothetical protein
VQIIGPSDDPEAALAFAKQFHQHNPYKEHHRESRYVSVLGLPTRIEDRIIYFTPEEQFLMESYQYLDRKPFHFVVRHPDGKIQKMSIENVDKGIYVNEEGVAQIKLSLSRRLEQRAPLTLTDTSLAALQSYEAPVPVRPATTGSPEEVGDDDPLFQQRN